MTSPHCIISMRQYAQSNCFLELNDWPNRSLAAAGFYGRFRSALDSSRYGGGQVFGLEARCALIVHDRGGAELYGLPAIAYKTVQQRSNQPS